MFDVIIRDKMKFELTIHPNMWDRDGRVYKSGLPINYIVEGLPPGDEAEITKLGNSWRITRLKDSIRSESPVDYSNEHEALASLQG